MGSSLYDITHKNLYVKKGLSVFVVLSLVMGLMPTLAFGSTTVGVKVEAPAQITKIEQVVPAEEDTPANQTEASTPEAQSPDVTTQNTTESASEQPTPAQTTADIPLTQQSTILQDGLEYTVNPDNKSVSVAGWYGSAPEGDIIIPSVINHESTTYAVTIIRGGANS